MAGPAHAGDFAGDFAVTIATIDVGLAGREVLCKLATPAMVPVVTALLAFKA